MGTNFQPNSFRASRSEPEDCFGGERANERPVLVLNPRHDVAFVDAAKSLLDGDALSPEALQNSLRKTYLDAVVRPRELSGEATVVWYVFREGHWINGGPHSKS